jgi:dynein heavy chain, axonemal
MNLASAMPTIFMKPTEKIPKSKNIKFYQCPVYYYPIREGTRENPSFLFEMSVPMNPEYDESFFIKRGTACLLNLGD